MDTSAASCSGCFKKACAPDAPMNTYGSVSFPKICSVSTKENDTVCRKGHCRIFGCEEMFDARISAYFNVGIGAMVVVSGIIGLISFFLKLYDGDLWRHGIEFGIASDLDELVENPYVVLCCVLISILALPFYKMKLLERFFTEKTVLIFFFIGIMIPLLIQGVPLLGFAFDVVFSTGMGGVDVHVLQAFAVFAAAWMGHRREAVFLLLLFRSAHCVENVAHAKSARASDILETLTPTSAFVYTGPALGNDSILSSLRSAEWQAREVHEVAVGDYIRVRQGELVPLKGRVISDNPATWLKQPHIDGEDIPFKVTEDSVLAVGAVVTDGGPLFLQVTHREGDGEIALLKRLLVSAGETKAPLQSAFDLFTEMYSKIMIFIALALLFGLPRLPGRWAVPVKGPSGAAYRTLAFLVAGAPCALVISTPIAYWCTYSNLASHQISIADMSVIESLNSVDTVIFDKTGTLTVDLAVDRAMFVDFANKQVNSTPDAAALHKIAAATWLLEEGERQLHGVAAKEWAGNHLATSSSDHQKGTIPVPGTLLKDVQRSKERKGVEATVQIEGRVFTAAVGSTDFVLRALKIGDRQHNEWLERLESADPGARGVSLIAMKEEGRRPMGCLLVYRDKLRPEARQTIEELIDAGKNVFVLSGDRDSRVAKVAARLGVPPDNVKGGMTPEAKRNFVRSLEQRGARVAMVGDEGNDAPAMKEATVGIAVVRDDNITSVVQSSDVGRVVLAGKSDSPRYLTRIPYALKEGARCRSIIIQNIVLAMLGLLVVAPSAVCGLIPFWLSVVGHEGGTVCVALNSLRALG